MSVTEDFGIVGEDVGDVAAELAGEIGDATEPELRSPQRVLLVWDAPNLDMGLGSILGGRPTAAHRPRFDALGRWLLARTACLLYTSPSPRD